MVRNLFMLDLRSLALARVLLGVLSLYDIFRRVPDIPHFFSDSGILPRWLLLEKLQHSQWSMSLLFLNGSAYWAYVWIFVGLLAAVFFILGWKTRISNALLWVIIISFQLRFPEASTSGGDMLLRIFLFYSFFLPMNAYFSIDRVASEEDFKKKEYASVFTMAWIIQIILLYILTFLYKWSPVYHTTFDAVWYMLQLDHFTTDFGEWLGQHHKSTRMLSALAYGLEFIGPLLLLIPLKRDFFRGVAVLSFWMFHLGIGMTLHLGNFVPICLIIWVGLIPSAWWDYASKKILSFDISAGNLFYQSECNFSRTYALVGKELLFLNFNLLPASGEILNKHQKFAFQAVDGRMLTGFSIFPALLKTSSLRLIRFIGELLTSDLALYLSEVSEAGEIKVFGQESSTSSSKNSSLNLFFIFKLMMETIGFGKLKMTLHRFEIFFGRGIIALVVLWNIEGYVTDRKWYIGSPFDEIMFMFQLNQGWAMFAPHPQRVSGWWIMEGHLRDGRTWDALNNKEVSFQSPDDFYDTYPSDDWRKFLDNLSGSRDTTYLNLLGKHLCRKWNAENVGKNTLETFKLYFMQEWTNPPTEARAGIKKVLLWNHQCF